MGKDVITLAGPFAERDRWTAEGWCSIERALGLIGTRSAMVLMRESFYGGRRFEELTRRAGITEAVAAKRLKQLVAGGVLRQVPYREPGSRTRHEYELTDRGRALFPVLVALLEWGDLLDDGPGGIELIHDECGAPIEPHVRCAAGHEVPITETVARIARRPAR
ncbi:MAG TPA: helix-turn-helix domain-containing protein [Pseudonocardiaceae bacterium]|nr:helix-turn-helix domain-containing protein [Pseudonocardiaceae bacterium]